MNEESKNFNLDLKHFVKKRKLNKKEILGRIASSKHQNKSKNLRRILIRFYNNKIQLFNYFFKFCCFIFYFFLIIFLF